MDHSPTADFRRLTWIFFAMLAVITLFGGKRLVKCVEHLNREFTEATRASREHYQAQHPHPWYERSREAFRS